MPGIVPVPSGVGRSGVEGRCPVLLSDPQRSRAEDGHVTDIEQCKNGQPRESTWDERPYDAADYAIVGPNATGDVPMTLRDEVSEFGHSNRVLGQMAERTSAETVPIGFQASRSGVTTTGDQRVRNTPPRIATAPTDWAAVIGSPSHSQPMTMAAIGVRLL